MNNAQIQASFAQQQLNNSNIARQVQFQMIQNQKKYNLCKLKMQPQNANAAATLHSGQSAAALHAINNVHNAKFQAEQVRNRGQMVCSFYLLFIYYSFFLTSLCLSNNNNSSYNF